MAVSECPYCGRRVEQEFRFCPSCAGVLRVKITEFFRAHAGLEDDAGKALRVSRYLGAEPAGRHVRFSVWNESGEAEAAVSLDEREVSRLARFLAPRAPDPRPTLRRLVETARRR
jgi:hypothetical protein